MLGLPYCYLCKHFDRDAPNLACAAFPAGIPRKILAAEADHRKPWPDDHGIQFEALSDDELRAKGLLGWDPFKEFFDR